MMTNTDNFMGEFGTPIWYCPHCGKSDYTPSAGMTTCVYYPPRIVDGINVNPDRNTTTESRQCNACGQTTIIIY